MPKTEIRYDDRLMLKLESELHQAVKAYAGRHGISVNEAIRRAIKRLNGLEYWGKKGPETAP